MLALHIFFEKKFIPTVFLFHLTCYKLPIRSPTFWHSQRSRCYWQLCLHRKLIHCHTWHSIKM